MLAPFKVWDHPPGMQRERERYAARRDLWQRHSHEDQPANQEIRPDEWASHPDQQAHVDGIPQEEMPIQYFAQGIHLNRRADRDTPRSVLWLATLPPVLAPLHPGAARSLPE